MYIFQSFNDVDDIDISIYECEGEAVSNAYGSCVVTIRRKICDQVENWVRGTEISVATADLVGSKEELIARIFSLKE